MRIEQLLNDVAVLLVDEIAAPVAARHLHGLAAAIHRQAASVGAYLDALLDDDTFEDGVVLGAIAKLDLNGLSGDEPIGIADRERAPGGFAVFDVDARRRDAVELAAHGDGSHLQIARDVHAVDEKRHGTDIRRRRRRDGGRIAHETGLVFSIAGKRRSTPVVNRRKFVSAFTRATWM